jgi:hypothetical protein
MFRREYPEVLEDVLLADEDMVFPQWAIQQCISRYDLPVEAVRGAHPHRYFKMWDEGRKNDAAVGVCLDISSAPYVLVDYQRHVKKPFPFLQEQIETQHKRWPGPTYVGDDNVAAAIVENLHIPASHFLQGASLKPRAIGALKAALEEGYLEIPPIPQLIFELGSYMWDDEGLVQDSVMALANALYHIGPPIHRFERASVAETEGRMRSRKTDPQQDRPVNRIAMLSGSTPRRGRHTSTAPEGQSRDADYI